MISDNKRQLIEKSFGKSEMLQLFNASIVALDKDFISISVPKMPFMARKAGMFNGATIASLVDVSSGFAAVSHYDDDCYVVTVELKVNYLRPAIGETLLSESSVIKGGKKICVVRTEIYTISSEGTKSHVSTSLVTLMRIK